MNGNFVFLKSNGLGFVISAGGGFMLFKKYLFIIFCLAKLKLSY